MVDLAIIGGGPAALSAALYAARAGLSVSVYEKADFGGVVSQIALIENYPGYTGGSGRVLALQMRQQAEQAGAELSYGECTAVAKVGQDFQLTIDGESVSARAVLVASGSLPRELSFTPAAPVSYCALCDGPLVKGKNIAVVGGANSAVQEALFLADIAQSVTIITHSRLKADAELLQRLPQHTNIRVIEQTEPTPENLAPYDHIFVYIGKIPATDFLQPLAAKHQLLTRQGYIITAAESKYPHQTALAGLFAAGDVRENSIKQAVVAASEGALSAIEITNYLHFSKK